MKIVLTIGGILTLLTLGLYIISRAKYDLNDITADNAMDKLTIDHSRSLRADGNCLSHMFGNSTIYNEPNVILSNQYWAVEKQEVKAGVSYQITNKTDWNVYTFRFLRDGSDIMDYFSVQNAVRQNVNAITVMPIYKGKEMVNQLLFEEGFILKATDRKNYFDILIKDVGDDFLIGKVYWMSNAQDEVQILEFMLYHKFKFHIFS
jgi:hypothetical protein